LTDQGGVYTEHNPINPPGNPGVSDFQTFPALVQSQHQFNPAVDRSTGFALVTGYRGKRAHAV